MIENFQTISNIRLNVAEQNAQHPKAVLVIMHGLGEHIGRYQHVFDYFNHKDINVMGCDFPGHGKSDGGRGHVPGGIERMMNIVQEMVDKAKSENPNLPVFLFGHSMGGCVVVNFLMKRKPVIAGVIASAPALKLAFEPPKFLVFLGRLTVKIIPSFAQPNNLERAALSRDKAVVDAYSKDLLVHDLVSSALGIGLLDAGKWAIANIANADLSSPLLVYHGTADRLTSSEGTKEFAQLAKGKVTFKSWDGLYHEMHNEPEKELVLANILEWMESNY
jgi:acylglycerol lipase